MPNRVFLNSDGILEQIYVGDQSGSAIDKAVKQAVEIIKQLREDQRPVLVIVDLFKMGKLNTPGRKVSVDALRNVSYDKIAIYGANTFSKALTNLIVHASGQHRKVRIFDDRAAAEAWLKS